MTAKTVRMALAAALLGTMSAAGCGSSSKNGNPSTMPAQRPTTMPAAEGRRASASPADQRVRYVADMPPIQPVKPPMPVAPPEQPPVKPVKPPMPDRTIPADPNNNGENKQLRPEDIQRELKPEDLKGLHEAVEHPVKHVVVIWLKNHGDKAVRKALLDGREKLRTIPGVLDISAGECLSSDRSVVDSSYDVALVVTFKDEAAMKAYGTHPTHVKLVEEVLKPNAAKFVVYDFVAK